MPRFELAQFQKQWANPKVLLRRENKETKPPVPFYIQNKYYVAAQLEKSQSSIHLKPLVNKIIDQESPDRKLTASQHKRVKS
jgi:hypothetical protein